MHHCIAKGLFVAVVLSFVACGGGSAETTGCASNKPCASGYACIQGSCIPVAAPQDIPTVADLETSGDAGTDGQLTDASDQLAESSAPDISPLDLVDLSTILDTVDTQTSSEVGAPDAVPDLTDISEQPETSDASDLGAEQEAGADTEQIETDDGTDDGADGQVTPPLDPFTGQWCGTLTDSGKQTTLTLLLGSFGQGPKPVPGRQVAAGRMLSQADGDSVSTMSSVMLALDETANTGNYRMAVAAFVALNGTKALIRLDGTLSLAGLGIDDDSFGGTWKSASRNGTFSLSHCTAYPGLFGPVPLTGELYFKVDLFGEKVFNGEKNPVEDLTAFEVRTTAPMTAVVVTVNNEPKTYRLEAKIDLLTIETIPEELTFSARFDGPVHPWEEYLFRGRDSNDNNISGIASTDTQQNNNGWSLQPPRRVTAVVNNDTLTLSWDPTEEIKNYFSLPDYGHYRAQIRHATSGAVLFTQQVTSGPATALDLAQLVALGDGEYVIDVYAVGVDSQGPGHGIDFAVAERVESASFKVEAGKLTVLSLTCPTVRPDVTNRLAANVETVMPAGGNTLYQIAFAGNMLYVGNSYGVYRSAIGPPWNFSQVPIENYVIGNASNAAVALRAAGNRLFVSVNRYTPDQAWYNLFIVDTDNGSTVHASALDQEPVKISVDPNDGNRVFIGGSYGRLWLGERTAKNPDQWQFTWKNSGSVSNGAITDVVFSDPIVAGSEGNPMFYEWDATSGLFTDTQAITIDLGGWPAALLSWRPGVTDQELLIGVAHTPSNNMFKGVVACAAPCRTPSAYVGNTDVLGGYVHPPPGAVGGLVLRLLPDNRIVLATGDYFWVAKDASDPANLLFKLVPNARPDCYNANYFDAQVHGNYLYVSVSNYGIVRMPLSQLQ